MRAPIFNIATIALLLLVVCLAPLRAQQSGSLTGNALDPDGAAVTQARVKLQRAASAIERQATSDVEGHFEFSSLDPGAYQLTAEAPGFAALSLDVAVFPGRVSKEDVRFRTVSSLQQVTVVASSADALSPDPTQRTFVHDDLLEANPGRPGAPVSIPGLPIETASGGIKAPQYFAPGVAGDHGEPIAQFIQVGSFLLPNNLNANAHGNGYADPNIMVPAIIESVQTDGGAFNVLEGNHSVDAAAVYAIRPSLEPFATLTGDYRDVDLSAGW